MTTTDNYSLKKPDEEDFYDINIHNSNCDTIDGLIFNLDANKQNKTSARNSFIKADENGNIIGATINKNNIGLSNVDNTRDIDKPISNHTRNEINNIKNSLQRNINAVQNSTKQIERVLNDFKSQIHYEHRFFRACIMSEAGGEWPGNYRTDGRMTRIGHMIFATFDVSCNPPGRTDYPLLIGGFPYRPNVGGGAIVHQGGILGNVGHPRQFTLSHGGNGHSFYIHFSTGSGQHYDTLRELHTNSKPFHLKGYVVYFI